MIWIKTNEQPAKTYFKLGLSHSETCNLQLELWISQYITNDNSKKHVLSSMRNLICITIWPFFKRAPHPPDFTINWRYKIRSCHYILVISEILSWDFFLFTVIIQKTTSSFFPLNFKYYLVVAKDFGSNTFTTRGT